MSREGICFLNKVYKDLDLSIKDSLVPSNFLFHLIREALEHLYLLQTKEIGFPFLYNKTA